MSYTASKHALTNKPLGIAQAVPADGRGCFYDEVNFKYRYFTSTSEVLTYLDTTVKRKFAFPIWVNTGGTLINGAITGGTNKLYYFKDGQSDSDLVEMIYAPYSNILSSTIEKMWSGADTTIAFEGDSITYGQDTTETGVNAPINGAGQTRSQYQIPESFSEALGTLFNLSNVTVINRGFPGDRTQEGITRWVNEDPVDCVFVMYGHNDAFDFAGYGSTNTIEQYKNNLEQIIDRRLIQGSSVIVLGPPRILDITSNQKLRLYVDASKEIAEKKGLLFIDIDKQLEWLTPFVGFYTDGVHLTATMYRDSGWNLTSLFTKFSSNVAQISIGSKITALDRNYIGGTMFDYNGGKIISLAPQEFLHIPIYIKEKISLRISAINGTAGTERPLTVYYGGLGYYSPVTISTIDGSKVQDIFELGSGYKIISIRNTSTTQTSYIGEIDFLVPYSYNVLRNLGLVDGANPNDFIDCHVSGVNWNVSAPWSSPNWAFITSRGTIDTRMQRVSLAASKKELIRYSHNGGVDYDTFEVLTELSRKAFKTTIKTDDNTVNLNQLAEGFTAGYNWNSEFGTEWHHVLALGEEDVRVQFVVLPLSGRTIIRASSNGGSTWVSTDLMNKSKPLSLLSATSSGTSEEIFNITWDNNAWKYFIKQRHTGSSIEYDFCYKHSGTEVVIYSFKDDGSVLYHIPIAGQDATASNHLVTKSQLDSLLTTGQNTIVGDGVATTFIIIHGLTGILSTSKVLTNVQSFTNNYATVDATNITINFETAPVDTTSIVVDWQIIK